MRIANRLVVLAAAVTMAATVAACGGGANAGEGGTAAGGGGAAPLTVAAYSQPTLQPNFNPFSINALRGTVGLIYEQLFDFNTADKSQFMPSLATKYTWKDKAGKALDLALDPKAKWSDGSALTADDVIFTIEYLRKNELLTVPVDKITASDDGVSITFTDPAYAQLQDLGRIAIVPKKIWASKNAETDTNEQPMGSGPYTLGQVTGQQVTFKARSDYWKQQVPVPQLNYVTTSNISLLTQQLLRHDVDLAYAGIPDVQAQYVDKAPDTNHLWPVYGSMKPLLLNLTRPPFDNEHVRKGIALSVDRKAVTDAYNPGVYQPVGPTGLYQKTWADWIPEADREPVAKDEKAALAEFAKAGYQSKDGKLIGQDGKQLSIKIHTVSSFADGMAYSTELASQLSSVGIDASVNGVPSAAYVTDEGKGNFDAIYGDAYTFGANPFQFYDDMLSSTSKKNLVGWKDPATDKALAALATAAPDAQQAATAPLEKIMVEQQPVIPIAVKGTPYMYSTAHWTGWPSADNPFTTPDPGAISGVYAATLFLALKQA